MGSLTNHVGAVVLVVALALRALETRPNLSANTDAVALFYILDAFAHLDCLADDLVAYADRSVSLAPTAGDSVNIGAADTAALDLDVDVIITEGLGLELCASLSVSLSHWWSPPHPWDRAALVEGKRTVCFLNSLYLPISLIMNPSNSSGYGILKEGCFG